MSIKVGPHCEWVETDWDDRREEGSSKARLRPGWQFFESGHEDNALAAWRKAVQTAHYDDTLVWWVIGDRHIRHSHAEVTPHMGCAFPTREMAEAELVRLRAMGKLDEHDSGERAEHAIP